MNHYFYPPLNGTLFNCVQKILTEGLRVHVDPEFETERAHRAPVPMPDPDQPLRPLFIHFLRQSEGDKVITTAKDKRGVEWDIDFRCSLT